MYVIIVIIVILGCIIVIHEFPLSHSPNYNYINGLGASTHSHTHTYRYPGWKRLQLVGGGPCRPSSECTQILDECITLSAWLCKIVFGTYIASRPIPSALGHRSHVQFPCTNTSREARYITKREHTTAQ